MCRKKEEKTSFIITEPSWDDGRAIVWAREYLKTTTPNLGEIKRWKHIPIATPSKEPTENWLMSILLNSGDVVFLANWTRKETTELEEYTN